MGMTVRLPIPHTDLMKAVAKRVVDGRVLRLIHDWLKAPVVEVGEDGKERWNGGRKSRVGTPQGGVVSPLLANLYLHALDRAWKEGKLGPTDEVRLVRYADDFVVMARPGQAAAVGDRVKEVIGSLKLTLNGEKTHIRDMTREWLGFLGFEMKKVRDGRTQREYVRVQPSRKAQKFVRYRISTYLRDACDVATADAIRYVNSLVRGWTLYFRYRDAWEAFQTLRYHLGLVVRRFLRRRAGRRGHGYARYPDTRLWREVGLFDPRKVKRVRPGLANA